MNKFASVNLSDEWLIIYIHIYSSFVICSVQNNFQRTEKIMEQIHEHFYYITVVFFLQAIVILLAGMSTVRQWLDLDLLQNYFVIIWIHKSSWCHSTIIFLCISIFTGRIQFDMLTLCQTKITDFMTTNRIWIELSFHAISSLININIFALIWISIIE